MGETFQAFSWTSIFAQTAPQSFPGYTLQIYPSFDFTFEMSYDDAFRAYCRRLRQNDPAIPCIEYRDDSVEMLQHLCESLYENTVVREFTVRLSSMKHHGMVALAKLLERNVTLKVLAVNCKVNTNLPEEEGFPIFAEALAHCHLHCIALYQNKDGLDFGDFFISCWNGLAQNTTIQKLFLHHMVMGDDDAIALGNALKANNSLQKLELEGSMSEVGINHICESLQQNSTITAFKAYGIPISSEGLLAMSHMLKKNTSIKILHLKSFDNIGTEAMRTLFRTIIEDNFTLECIDFYILVCSDNVDMSIILKTIGYLNTNGRRRKLLKETNDVPVGLWAYVFASTGKIGKCTDVLFHFVKSKPELFKV